MFKINTYNLTEEDFKRAYMSTVTPNQVRCKKCRARPGQPCEGLPPKIVHQERIQTLYTKCKNVLESVLDEKGFVDNWIKVKI